MYLDSAILVKLLVRESDSLFYANMVDGQIAWSAELALSECFSALVRNVIAMLIANITRAANTRKPAMPDHA